MVTEKLSTDLTSSKPNNLGDRYYSMDLIRDFWFLVDRAGQLGLDLSGSSSFVCGLTAGTVTKGTGDSLNITAVVGYIATTVSVPDSYASLPPTVKSETATVRVPLPTQTNAAVTGGQIDVNHYANATLNGSTVNYVKIRYIETDGQSRTRARAAGSYVYEKIPSYELRIEPVAATSSEIALASFTGTSGGSFTITPAALSRSLSETGALKTYFDTLYIAPVSWTSFTQAIHAVTSNPTKASSPSADTAYYSLNGKELSVRYLYSHTVNTGSAAGSGRYLYVLPLSKTIDFAKMPVEMPVGWARFYSGATVYQGQVIIDQSASTTAVLLEMGSSAQAFVQQSDAAFPLNGSTVVIEFAFTVTTT